MKTEEEYEEEEKEIDNILKGSENINARVPISPPPSTPCFSMAQSPLDALRSKIDAAKDTGVYNISIEGEATSTGKIRGSLTLVCKYCQLSKDYKVIPGISDTFTTIYNFTHSDNCLVKKLENI